MSESQSEDSAWRSVKNFVFGMAVAVTGTGLAACMFLAYLVFYLPGRFFR